LELELEAEAAAEDATFATTLPEDCDADADADPDPDETEPEWDTDDADVEAGATVYVEPPITVVLPLVASVTSGPPETDTTVAELDPDAMVDRMMRAEAVAEAEAEDFTEVKEADDDLCDEEDMCGASGWIKVAGMMV